MGVAVTYSLLCKLFMYFIEKVRLYYYTTAMNR